MLEFKENKLQLGFLRSSWTVVFFFFKFQEHKLYDILLYTLCVRIKPSLWILLPLLFVSPFWGWKTSTVVSSRNQGACSAKREGIINIGMKFNYRSKELATQELRVHYDHKKKTCPRTLLWRNKWTGVLRILFEAYTQMGKLRIWSEV